MFILYPQWYASAVSLSGLPSSPSFPAESSLLAGLRTRPQRAILPSTDLDADIEDLLSTGIFAFAQVEISPPAQYAYPGLTLPPGATSPTDVVPVPPLGSVTFSVTPRQLPGIISLKLATPDPAFESALAAAQARVNQKTPTLEVLLALHADLLAAGAPSASFAQVMSGNVVINIPAPSTYAGSSLPRTGLEASARGPDGAWASDIRAPRSLAAPDAQRIARAFRDSNPLPTSGEAMNFSPFRSWKGESRATAAPPPAGSPGDALAMSLTEQYGDLQKKAAKRTGVTPGEAWRASVAACLRVNVPLVVMGDRPTDETRRRFGSAIFGATASRAAGAVAVAVATVAGATGPLGLDIGPSLAAGVAMAAVGATFVALPLVGPLKEMGEFSELPSAAEIERAVAVKEPLHGKRETTKLWGEDALIGWPGAYDPIIGDRDRFMALAIARAAAGKGGVAPVWSLDRSGATYRYGMPADGRGLTSCPVGEGDGELEVAPGPRRDDGRQGRVVVAIVGTAHTGGIVSSWNDAVANKLSAKAFLG